MEKLIVVGKLKNSFVPADRKDEITYYRLHCITEESPQTPGVFGKLCRELKVSASIHDSVQIGDVINPLYDRFGKVQAVEV